ncbi:hypothetical protein SAMN04487948_11495 [Halogranum amylolyticum]|uniref:Uncharacterized protein n=1 Tax=Halogranum amylolyticum TaxID=660520 RepID=A0A1H8V6V7_9EURY|nr:hypothetical protein [Halogranum amylolyticum]SEP11101.1 hypothetical protein SAMN04487948_11495 [Halogranum amylolyticum]
MIYTGDGETLSPLREVGDPVADAVKLRPCVEFRPMFDGRVTIEARNYWKSYLLPNLSDRTIDGLCEHAAR